MWLCTVYYPAHLLPMKFEAPEGVHWLPHGAVPNREQYP